VNQFNRSKSVVRGAAGLSAIGLAVALFMGSAQPAEAQQSVIDDLRAQIQALTERLNKLEDSGKATSDTVAKNAPTVSSKEKVVISGLVQTRVEAYNDQNGPNYDTNATNSTRAFDTFRIRRAELRLTAPAITPRISGVIMFDLAKQLSQSTSSSSNYAVSQSSTFFQEAQISYLLRKGRVPAPGTTTAAGTSTVPPVPNNIYIDAGQFKLPIGYEGDMVSSSATQIIDRALMFQARDPFGGGNGDVRDTGVQLRGTQGQFSYWLGAFNGLGERQNSNSASDNKAVVGRLAFRPTSVPGLVVGVSAASGDNRNTGGTNDGNSQRADRRLFNAFAAYKKNKWTLQSEFVTTSADSQNASLSSYDRSARGYYGHVGYLFTPKIEGVLRYDYYNFDRNLGDAAVRDLIAGVNYYIKGNNAKIQLNVVRRSGGSDLTSTNGFGSSGSSSNPRGFATDRTEVRLQGQIGF
jgi:hypothetical protein